ncbi:MAG: hypothetical protein OSA89_09500, partial [Mariniblastus sp.]|nr:hypothetical protein [Mariniblastus sp.]
MRFLTRLGGNLAVPLAISFNSTYKPISGESRQYRRTEPTGTEFQNRAGRMPEAREQNRDVCCKRIHGDSLGGLFLLSIRLTAFCHVGDINEP